MSQQSSSNTIANANNNSNSAPATPPNDPSFYASVRSLYSRAVRVAQERKACRLREIQESEDRAAEKFNAMMARTKPAERKRTHRVIVLDKPSVNMSFFNQARGSFERVQEKKFQGCMRKKEAEQVKGKFGSGFAIPNFDPQGSEAASYSSASSPNTTPAKRPGWERLSPELEDEETWSNFLRMGEVWDGDGEPVMAPVEKMRKQRKPKAKKIKKATITAAVEETDEAEKASEVSKGKKDEADGQSGETDLSWCMKDLEEEDTQYRLQEGLPPRDDVGPTLWW